GDNLGGDVLHTVGNGLVDTPDIDPVAVLVGELSSLGEGEGDDAPVDAVGAVALGGVLVADVGEAPQYLLAGGGLLTGGAVAGLVAEHAGAHGGVGRIAAHLPKHFGYLGGNVPGLPGLFQSPDRLGPAHVLRHPAAEGEFAQADGVGAVGAGF